MNRRNVDVQSEREHLLAQIESKADPHNEQVIKRSIPSLLKVYGLRVFEIRQILKTWRRGHRGLAVDDLLALVRVLWDGESREERMLALELLRHYPDSISSLTWQQLDGWHRESDNWELIDVLGLTVLGPWIGLAPEERVPHLWDLVGAENVWSRRLGLVATFGLRRSGADIDSADLTLRLVDQAKQERHPMISKAISWLLRELGEKHPHLVTAYLEENEALLPRHVVREVTNKLTTGRKSG